MRRLSVIPVMLAAATCVALIPMTGASAKPPPLTITAIVGGSTGSLGAFCEFGVVVTYSPSAKHPETVGWTINSATENSKVGGTVPVALGPSPFTPAGLVLQLAAGSYYFDVQLLAKGSVRSEQMTGTFKITTTGTCPTAGTLAMFP